MKSNVKSPYDIIISDYMLPGMNGLEFLKAVQMNPKRPFKVLITDFGIPEVFAQAREYGATCCIEKPLTVEKLETCLVQLIDY